MLRVTRLDETESDVTLKLEGQIVGDWVSVLEEECRSLLHRGQTVALDFSDVRYVGPRGVEMLKGIAADGVHVTNCPSVVEELLNGGP